MLGLGLTGKTSEQKPWPVQSSFIYCQQFSWNFLLIILHKWGRRYLSMTFPTLFLGYHDLIFIVYLVLLYIICRVTLVSCYLLNNPCMTHSLWYDQWPISRHLLCVGDGSPSSQISPTWCLTYKCFILCTVSPSYFIRYSTSYLTR